MSDLRIVLKEIARERKDVWYSVLFGFLGGATTAGLFASSGYLISKAALVPPVYTLALMIAFLKVFGLAKAGSRYGERIYSHRATFNILARIRVNFFEKLEPLAPGIFQKFRSGDLLARIVGDVESLQNFFLRVYYPPVVLVLIFLSTMFFTAFYSIWISVLFLAGLLLTGLILPALFALRRKKLEEEVRETRAALSTDAAEVLYGFRDLKIYQQLVQKQEALRQSAASYVSNQEKTGSQGMLNQSFNQSAGLLVSWGVLAMSVYLAVNGELDALFLAMLVMLALTVFENATPMALLANHYEDSRHAAQRLNEVTDMKPAEAVEPFQSLEKTVLDLQFKDVSYTFEGESRPVVDSVSFSLPAGSKTAIVGASGSGKSTIFQLILGILRTDEGEVSIGGKNLKNVPSQEIWRHANVVMQENHFFFGTIRDNLMIAGEGLSDDELNEALHLMDLARFTLDDPVLEKGENLSGGERQRLAIARALLKGDRLWLLDEPTSSVDSVTENKVMSALFEKAENDTLLLISHRLTGLEQMDRILVMDHGKLVESGSYHELMEKKGVFFEMKQIEQEVFL
ncbi:thiol reductant ABC exporter subunit CydC [Jeotgalibacillus aurantiacus]|uniref:thiol reductant ABC exporter subunit CydC n=1 Tax=Jeotgalibacillus aurantiacus TaxID=2763266 RepID=UPI001D0BC2FE|nr:thiol reductant ABC exporter subunit CydC [Jeotgalibacillus aurantiacus]